MNRTGIGRHVRRKSPRSGLWRFFDYLLAATIFGLLLLFIARMDAVSTQSRMGQVQVHDGDTVTVDGVRMRLKGLDAPEYRQTCQAGNKDYPCGAEARKALAEMVQGRAVTCEGWEKDKYGRLLALCRVGSVDINAELVRAGWAVSYGAYGAEEKQARAAQRGMWRGHFDAPQDWRKQHQPQQVEPPHDPLASIFNWLRQLIWPAASS